MAKQCIICTSQHRSVDLYTIRPYGTGTATVLLCGVCLNRLKTLLDRHVHPTRMCPDDLAFVMIGLEWGILHNNSSKKKHE